MTDESQVVDTNELILQRRQKLAALREKGIAFPNSFKRKHLAKKLHDQYGQLSDENLMGQALEVSLAGRIMTRRMMGKASFLTLQDVSGRMQLYVREDALSHELYEAFKHWDIGDIIAVQGQLFKTKTGELSVKAKEIHLLTKALRPLPDKYHGLTDQEVRYRQRYLDLMVNEEARKTFLIRTKVVEIIRQFLKDREYLEVETPMLQVLAGGAAAKPFITHHNALDMTMYLRIAPELYLKRLVVGGFERVFEINRSFRNEGVSTRHNPEFTMLEFYQAYADYEDMMDLTEELFQLLAKEILNTAEITYGDQTFDVSQPFTRITMFDAILKYNANLTAQDLSALDSAIKAAENLNLAVPKGAGLGKVQLGIFEATVEHQLKQPTFITAYPSEVSPLARLNDDNPFITDRFELFMGGRELANGFSELNDADDQAQRFLKQVQDKEAGDDEAMPYDEDYIQALEYGMPPTAGEGIGIDRLVMLFANQMSIRDVILFPHMKPN